MLSPYLLLLLVPAPPLAVFLILGLDPFFLRRKAVQGLALLGGIAPFFAMLPLLGLCLGTECRGVMPIFTLVFGQSEVALALLLDPMSTLVGLTVAAVGAMVMTYAIDYMSDARIADLRRFFALMNLFLAAMLTMVLAGDTITFFFGWELMGLCSFFLIAYNTGLPQAVAAGRKAFIITRFADAFLLAGLLLLFLEANSVRLDVLIPAGTIMTEDRHVVIALLLLAGALGKSAQVPFHTWLPSAMAGPTPVSALLHSATMVAAGAFMLARFSPIVMSEPAVQAIAAIFGVGTAAFGALSAIFQADVKRLLAYSSISQIGFMVLAVGLGAPQVAIAHFVVHAMFKSLLFLAAGDITHGSDLGTSMMAMRGALRRRPIAFVTYVAGASSLAGLPFVTAGWWSKEAILATAWSGGAFGILVWVVALLTATCTAIYAFRPVFEALQPEPEHLSRARHGHAVALDLHYRKRWGSAFIGLPLVVLASGSLLGGVLVGPIIRFLGAEPPHPSHLPELVAAFAPFLGIATAAALTFVPSLAAAVAGARDMRRPTRLDRKFQRWVIEPYVRLVRFLAGNRMGARAEAELELRHVQIVRWLSRGARMDGIYQALFVRPFVNTVRWLTGHRGGTVDPVGTLPVTLAQRGMQALVTRLAHDRFDRFWMRSANRLVRLWVLASALQTGRSRDYALGAALGTAALLVIAWGTTWN
ncbi:oxidoreductase [Cereibacter sphaeroides]|uniref:NADH-quinone oxidoreductase subunit 5 family protein n=1 Tax=Cereibacter sphaeroides TaxID=1063 RepID=UPI000E5BF6DA|nr:proton-conducting transporter membrane subunit [Cereibacter sphaeroides]RHZ94363.1 oxidoreductase [Cereibacter sphaeroides]